MSNVEPIEKRNGEILDRYHKYLSSRWEKSSPVFFNKNDVK